MLVESGTQALTLALSLAVAGSGRPPRVALPAFGCFDLASAAVGADADVMVYDIDPATLSPDLISLERVLRSGVDAVVVAHLYGVPADWNALKTVVGAAGALLIEDAAQGHGGTLDGHPLGSLGDLSVLSFGRGKGWTGGGGGALLVRRGHPPPTVPPPARSRVGPMIAAWLQWAVGRPSLFGLPHLFPWLRLGETVYTPPRPVRAMATGPAALVLSTRHLAEGEARLRREAGRWYREQLSSAAGGGLSVPLPPPGATPGYLRFPVRSSSGSRGILSRPEAMRAGLAPCYPRPIAELPALRDRLRGPVSCPGADDLVRELFTLPTHGFVSPPDRIAILDLLQSDARRRS